MDAQSAAQAVGKPEVVDRCWSVGCMAAQSAAQAVGKPEVAETPWSVDCTDAPVVQSASVVGSLAGVAAELQLADGLGHDGRGLASLGEYGQEATSSQGCRSIDHPSSRSTAEHKGNCFGALRSGRQPKPIHSCSSASSHRAKLG